MTTTLAFLPSPLLGPAVWAAVGFLLADRGWTVAIPPPFGRIRSPADVLAHWEHALSEAAEYVVMPHSNAGLYVPELGERRRVVGTVFVDAALPPATGSTPMAPPGLYRMLAGLADSEGLLPPWTEWWGDAELADLFPDATTRDTVAAEQVRLPLSYFAHRMPVAAGWTHRPAAYLAFGDTYQREREAAASSAWPVKTLPGGHLLMLTEPTLVAAALEDLLGTLGMAR
ncbi:hypothetical protein [Mycetocola sp.]|uniref:hypothetical protein n=1 Tax=Mycetocola sp. TaxID=1871042 RepID=UPI003988D228